MPLLKKKFVQFSQAKLRGCLYFEIFCVCITLSLLDVAVVVCVRILIWEGKLQYVFFLFAGWWCVYKSECGNMRWVDVSNRRLQQVGEKKEKKRKKGKREKNVACFFFICWGGEKWCMCECKSVNVGT